MESVDAAQTKIDCVAPRLDTVIGTDEFTVNGPREKQEVHT